MKKAVFKVLIRHTGLTFIELLIAMAVLVILTVALSLFVGRSFEISREQLEQVRITEDARIRIERMSDRIRNAQFFDCNNDGDTDDINEHWLRAATSTSIQLYSNVDDDQTPELIRYYMLPDVADQKMNLYYGVTQLDGDCTAAGAEAHSTVLLSLRNADQAPATALFRYFETGSDSTELSAPIDRAKVKRVRVQLVVDVSNAQNPQAAFVETDIAPRSVECEGDNCGPASCLDAGDAIWTYDYNSATFAGDAFQDCMDHCATNSDLEPGECCAWNAALYFDNNLLTNPGELVTSACQCQNSYLSGDATHFPQPGQDPEQYTEFARECFDGTICGAGVAGVAYCDAGCLVDSGECYCRCPN